jgi:NAD(P)-dependent dehydrogenase (short-subunit alcohol dehydrogenase family)
MSRLFDLTGRRALVTGSSRGIGRAIAQGLAEAGAAVCVHGIERDNAQSVADEILVTGGRACVATGDIASDRAPEAILRAAAQGLDGPPDILILNAAAEIREDWDKTSRAAALAQFEINFLSTIAFIQGAAPAMIAQGWGRIVTIGSVQQARPHPQSLVYAALKSAQVNLVRNLARTFAPLGVTLNNVAPGVILTDRTGPYLADADYAARLFARIPAARPGDPEDCVGAVLLLCSDAGAYMIGADVFVDGGLQLNQ